MAEDISLNSVNGDLNLNLTIEIQNGNNGYFPEIVGSVTLTTERKGSPGKLVFSCIWDGILQVEEGNPVKLSVHGKIMFYGFIFTLNHTKSRTVQITAYDQIRYLLNKDTYVFKKATATTVIKMLAADYGIRTGEIEETAYIIPGRVMDNVTLLDMIQDCLDITLTNTKTLYCLYDDAGKLTLQQTGRMAVGLLIDAEAAEDFNYSSTIDSGTYNLIKLVYEEKKSGKGTGQRQIFVERSDETEKKWGTLQYFENITDTANAKNKAKTLLALYNAKNKALTLQNVIGDIRVRAGCLVLVRLTLCDMSLSNWMLVESCTHYFSENRHTMTLKMKGGEFVG